MNRASFILLAILTLLAWQTPGQKAETNAPSATESPPQTVDHEAEKAWAFFASVYGYFVPDSRDYAQPTLTADHG
jgi:hypothetical protein